jgi:protein-S-isoprenylcysteine O-methyltransferase Ste14
MPHTRSLRGGRIAWLGGALFVASLAYGAYAYAVVFARPATSGDWLSPAVVDVVLFSVFALHHSALARVGAREWVGRNVSRDLERSAYVWVASALFLITCWLWRPVAGIVWDVGGAGWALLVLQLAGVAMTIAASRQLDVLVLSGIRQAQGQTPGPPVLMVSGFYRFVRHPIYFAWLLMVWPVTVMTGTRLVFAIVSSAYLALAIPFEERSLVRLFGTAYGEYQRQVKWRMLPGVY